MKKELLNYYASLVEKGLYYDSIEGYVDNLHHLYDEYVKVKNIYHQIRSWGSFLHGDSLFYLGAYLGEVKGDMEGYQNAIYTGSIIKEISIGIQSNGFDHCAFYNLIPFLFTANRFHEIEHIYPKELGLSHNGHFMCRTATNLIMYLYYQDESFKEQAMKDGYDTLKRKSATKYDKAITSALMSLVEKDFEHFSDDLKEICKTITKVQDITFNPFTKNFAFSALGLYNFARYLYGTESDKITLPEENNFPMSLHEYQMSTNYKEGQLSFDLKDTVGILGSLLEIEIPTIKLEYVPKNEYHKAYSTTNNEAFIEELIHHLSK